MDAVLIILAGSLIAIPCSVLGVFLVLRRMTMIGDAISHAVLPGIVIAFLASGSRNPFPMILGAGFVGFLSTVFIESLHKKGRLQADAAIGVTFTSLFALGVFLISAFAGSVDLDQDCVLYGEIAYVPIDTFVVGQHDIGPRAIWLGGTVSVAVVGFVATFYRRLFATTFDPSFTDSIGIKTHLWHHLLMALVSMTTVVAFESVGAIVVVALFVAPALAASMVTTRLVAMLVVASVFGVACAIFGYLIAHITEGSIAGAMASFGGIEVILAIVYRRLAKA